MRVLSKHHIASVEVRTEWLERQLAVKRLWLCDLASLAQLWHGGQVPSPALPLWDLFLAVVRRSACQPCVRAESLSTMLGDVIGRSTVTAAEAMAVPLLRAVAADDAPLVYERDGSMLPALHAFIDRFGWRDLRGAVLALGARLIPEDLFGLATTLRGLGHHSDAEAVTRMAITSKHSWPPAALLRLMTECDESARVSLAKSMQAHFVCDAVRSTRDIIATHFARTRAEHYSMLRALVERRLAQLAGAEGPLGALDTTQPAMQFAKDEAAIRDLLPR